MTAASPFSRTRCPRGMSAAGPWQQFESCDKALLIAKQRVVRLLIDAAPDVTAAPLNEAAPMLRLRRRQNAWLMPTWKPEDFSPGVPAGDESPVT
jgi:hypothetical protein